MHWTHHVADLSSGEVLTSALHRPLAPISRAERISRLIPGVGPSIFDGPAFRLTPQAPYQQVPMASLTAIGALEYSSRLSEIWWAPPVEDDGAARQIMFMLWALPDQPSIASVSLIGNSYPGVLGQVTVLSNLGAGVATLAFGEVYSEHTLDLVVNPLTSALKPAETVITLDLQPGLEYLGFASVSFYPLPPLATA